MTAMLHGGERAIAAASGTPVWLDLSTGINPHPYPYAASHEAQTWLPQAGALEALLAAARTAYRVPQSAALVAAPGTQAILQWLPHIVPARRVAVLGPTYSEHTLTWERTAKVDALSSLRLGEAELVVVVNPNNPDGRRHAPDTLKDFAARLAAGPGRRLADGGHPVLVVDEAFMDLAPHDTVAGARHTLVLRSFGKFYGLAGLRLGFAIASPATARRLREQLGPWAVSGPAIEAGTVALADDAWAEAMRARLAQARVRLDAALADAGLPVVGGTDLFRLVATADAGDWHKALARRGIATRVFADAPSWLRFGLPGDGHEAFVDALAACGSQARGAAHA